MIIKHLGQDEMLHTLWRKEGGRRRNEMNCWAWILMKCWQEVSALGIRWNSFLIVIVMLPNTMEGLKLHPQEGRRKGEWMWLFHRQFSTFVVYSLCFIVYKRRKLFSVSGDSITSIVERTSDGRALLDKRLRHDNGAAFTGLYSVDRLVVSLQMSGRIMDRPKLLIRGREDITDFQAGSVKRTYNTNSTLLLALCTALALHCTCTCTHCTTARTFTYFFPHTHTLLHCTLPPAPPATHTCTTHHTTCTFLHLHLSFFSFPPWSGSGSSPLVLGIRG